ncbi:hypothetical protein CVT24_005518 [Panaeolus cyanescens]|uniref:Uncharacterized protein n=1 Tax=Panaeolus cyanescens TaxID=181874 RepID=A0A409YC09_9AGAR|nr:hypothetical protein CVT24_005518 [Panaeolus cyanescens]
MPISDNPLDYYQYYLASQRRVEQWVQETTRELQETSLTVPILHDTEDCLTAPETATTSVTRTTTVTGTISGASRKTTESPPPAESRSRPRPSSKKVKSSRDNDRSSRSKTLSSRKSRSTSTKHSSAIYRYLPYGVLPILLAVAQPSIPTVAAAVILLIGYMCMDYEVRFSSSWKFKV